jgi:hypothetical protein
MNGYDLKQNEVTDSVAHSETDSETDCRNRIILLDI